MDTRVLQYCIELSQHLNFTKVAENNFITQQALSQAIISLENQLGYKLFIRSNRSVKITPAGKAFIAKVSLGLKSINDAIKTGEEYAEGKCGEISLSCTGAAAIYGLQKATNGFAKEHPGIMLNIVNCSYKEAFRQLDAGITDAAFVPYLGQAIDTDTYNVIIKDEGHFYICVNKDHPLATKEKILPEDLLENVLINTDFKVSEIRQLINDEIYGFIGGVPKKQIKVNDFVSKSLMVAAGYGYALVLGDGELCVSSENLVLRKAECFEKAQKTALIWKKNNENVLLDLITKEK